MNIDKIRAAQDRLRGHVRRTPLLNSPFIDDIAGRPIWIKPECLQHTGSFKFRGALSALSGMTAAERARGVIAFSSGNHAQGVALAAKMHDVPAVIIMPSDAPAIKIANTRALGGDVVLYDRATESREDIGNALCDERGLTMIQPFDHPLVIAGQGTTGLEIAEQAHEVGVNEADVLVCCGGGGLTSGIALALEADAPQMTVRPAEPDGFNDVQRSLETGNRERNSSPIGSICDAIITPQAGELTFPIMSRLCGPGLVVTDHEALMAVRIAFERLKLVVEPGGAAALAAALFRQDQINAPAAIVVATGGNVDPETFVQALETSE